MPTQDLAAADPQQQQQQPRSGLQRAVAKFTNFFEERGLGAADIPAAIVAHELLGLVMAASFWAACYAVRPSRTLARPLLAAAQRSQQGAALARGYEAAMVQATRTVQRLSWLQKAPGIEPARLTVSLGESLCLRAGIKPLTFPFKLWASYRMVLLLKAVQQQQQQRRGSAPR